MSSKPTQQNLFIFEEETKFDEPLLGGKSGGFSITKEALGDMFHPDNIKNKQAETAISISLFNYWHKWGGPKGLVQRLKTD